MTYQELIQQLTPLHGAGEARAIARTVMEDIFHLSMADLLLGRDTLLTAAQQELLEQMADRLRRGEPVQHVVGSVEFCGLRLRVTSDVLIPRPETQELAQWAIGEMRGGRGRLRILDLCTGSGCLAIVLAHACPDAEVVAVDVSEAALAVARENADCCGTRNIQFLQQDLLASEAAAVLEEVCQGKVHGDAAEAGGCTLIIANPPYVCQSEAAGMAPTVLDYEPHLALFVPDDDALRFYRVIAQLGTRLLRPGGRVMVELNSALAHETATLFTRAGYTRVSIREDSDRRPRMMIAVK